MVANSCCHHESHSLPLWNATTTFAAEKHSQRRSAPVPKLSRLAPSASDNLRTAQNVAHWDRCHVSGCLKVWYNAGVNRGTYASRRVGDTVLLTASAPRSRRSPHPLRFKVARSKPAMIERTFLRAVFRAVLRLSLAVGARLDQFRDRRLPASRLVFRVKRLVSPARSRG